MQKHVRAKLSVLVAFGVCSVTTLAPAQALSRMTTQSPPSPQAAVLKHTKHFLVTNIVGQAHDRAATVTWSAPAGVYASQVVAYKVVANYKDPSSRKRVSTVPVVITDVAQRSATITGLMNGVWHDFTITAQSNTEWSAVNTNNVKNGGMVKPSGLPCAPTTVTAVPGKKRVTVKWNRPCNGGATATFSVNTYVGSTLVSSRQRIADNRSAPIATITGLISGAPYRFTVTSTNVNGSVESSITDEVIPRP